MPTDAAADGARGAPSTSGWHLAGRVLAPWGNAHDAAALYVEAGHRSPGVDDRFDREVREWGGARNAQTPPLQERARPDIEALSPHSMRLGSDEVISFATYFNGFPASYWRKWTSARRVKLLIETSGSVAIDVYRSNARGIATRVRRIDAGPETALTEVELDLGSFVDGGWYWFDLLSGEGDAILARAEWYVDGPPPRPQRLSIGITTINRVAYCVDTLSSIAHAAELRAHLDRVIVVDQGSDLVTASDDYPDLAARLAGQLEIIEQANLGGSGGFARGMRETMVAGDSNYHLLLDDDVRIEPEAILRALRFASHCRTPSIVGAHMFDLNHPTVLHSFGEAIEAHRFWWGPVNGVKEEWNLAFNGIRETPWLHRRTDVHYNGWWMCLIPVEVIRSVGLPLPVFIKWDDAEYGIRARTRGFPTVTLPGAGVWHVSWNDKDDTIDWQAYYHQRNWLVAALLHSPVPHGGGVVRESFQWLVKNGFSLRYSANAARLRALEDLFTGPEHLHHSLASTLPELRTLQASFPDSRFESDPEAFPQPVGLGLTGPAPSLPPRSRLVPWAAKTAISHLRRGRQDRRVVPQAVIPHRYAVWWYLSQFDSAIVSKADGTGAAWYRRDPDVLRSQLVSGARLHARLYREWDELAASYRSALPALTSVKAWDRTFGLKDSSP